MMKRIVFITTMILSLVCLATPAMAQDSTCYWHMANNQVVNLDRLCGTQTVLSGDAAFLADFQKLAGQYSGTIKESLTAYVTRDRDSAIAAAKTTCRVLRFGGVAAATNHKQALMDYTAVPDIQARQQITVALATSYYCPEFSGQ
jgi:Protein of unknown function (DUF732)